MADKQRKDPTQQSSSAPVKAGGARQGIAAVPQAPLLALQRASGNQAVARMLSARQRAAGELPTPVGQQVQTAIDAQSTGGEPLRPELREEMETAFGTDLEGVRLHTGAAVDDLASSLGARGFTQGHDVFLRSDRDPARDVGRETLAHELAHVAQGAPTAGAVMREPDVARGNPATGQPLAGSPNTKPPAVKSKVPSWLIGTPKDHMPGEPVPGYETARSRYTDTDRSAFIDAIEARRKENETTVREFLGEWSAQLLELWGTSVTEEMAKAASHSTLTFWGELAKFIVKESVIALASGGAGVAWKALELGAEELPLFAEKTIGLVTDLAADKVKEAGTGAETEPKIEATKERLDAKTKQLALLVKMMHTEEVIDTPWERYTAWVATAPLAELARFRLPPKLPPIPTTNIRTSVAAAIVGALQEPQMHDEPPARPIPGTGGDFTRQDPTEDEPISIFDDNVVIVHLWMGRGHSVVKGNAEIYTPSRVLRDVLIGQPLRQMPGVPMFIAIDPPPDVDREAAKDLIGAVRKISPAALHADERSSTDEPDALAYAYPRDEKQELRVIRYFEGRSERLTASGGGLAEQLWLYRWAQGDDLTALALEILRSAQLKSIESSTEAAQQTEGGSSRQTSLSLAELAAGLAQALEESLRERTDRAIRQLITEYVLDLKAATPEDRWNPYHWTGDWARLFLRDPRSLEAGVHERKDVYGR